MDEQLEPWSRLASRLEVGAARAAEAGAMESSGFLSALGIVALMMSRENGSEQLLHMMEGVLTGAEAELNGGGRGQGGRRAAPGSPDPSRASTPGC